MNVKNIVIGLFIILILASVTTSLFFFLHKKTICPDDFKNSQAKVNAFKVWVDDFFTKNPEANLFDMSIARKEFYEKNNCINALKRFNDYTSGKLDSKTYKTVDKIINNVINDK